MTAVKSGNDIYVEGVNNTLASITTDIGDTTFIEKVSTSPDIYRLKDGHDIYIRPAGELTIGNSSNYSFNETLEFDVTTNQGRFEIAHGGSLFVYGNVTLDFDILAGTGKGVQFWIFGKFYVRGDATYRPQFDNVYSTYWYWSSTSPSDFTHDIWDLEKCDFTSGFDAADIIRLYGQPNDGPYHIFKDIVFNGGDDSIILIEEYMPGSYRKMTFDNCQFINSNNYALYVDYQCSTMPVFKNCVLWGDNASINILVEELMYMYQVRHRNAFSVSDFEGIEGQNFAYFEGCDFRGDSIYLFYLHYGNLLLKSCEFHSEGAIRAMYARESSQVFIWTGNVFNSLPILKSNTAAYYHVFALDIEVKDASNNPIENANVLIMQKDGRSHWYFRTGSDGKIISHPDSGLAGKAFLIHKEWVSGDAISGVFEYWSDSSNSTYHTIIISKEGLGTYLTNLVMDQDRVLSVNLVPAIGGTNNKIFKPIGRLELGA